MNDFEPTMPDPAINESLAISLGLDETEYAKILTLIKRKPSYTEIGIFSAMWNEHCSYKSTKKWLRLLPGTGPNVIHGPGENAGVIDIGNGLAVAFKMESHNHPSYIEPYQGAATGVGGILRDIFTMGAQPIAAMNLLRLGAVDHPKTRHLLSGIVAGIAGYANSFGVPTVGGEVEFDAGYNGNCLVNVFAAGLVESDKIFTSAARGVGSPIIYLGAKTGRDGVGGATMASNEFNEAVEEKRPTVQVGDPYLEKCLCQACLELMASGAVLAIQDMGAAGLTCSAVEMGAKGGLGVHLKLDKVPVRETQMSAFEMMLSESQERMLVILKPGAQEKAAKIFQKWSLAFEEIGQTTDDGCLRVDFRGDQVACLPIFALADNAPEYDRPYERMPEKSAEPKSAQSRAETLPPVDCADMVLQLLSSPNHCSKAWVYEQYDCLVQGHTLAGPGGDAGIVQIRGDEHRALAFCVEACQRYGKADPCEAGRLAVGEAYRNLCAVGARPLGITDNLNFGNPENPVIMGQIVGAIEGIAEAARALSLPVVSGNVSLYNEMSGQAIPPTASIGAVGIIDDIEQRAVSRFGRSGDTVILIGGEGDHLGQTALMEIMHGTASGAPPKSDLVQEEKNGCFIRDQIAQGHLRFVHDIGSGGLALALAEMAISGNMGCHIHIDAPAHRRLFGEDQARYVVTIPPHECALFVENAKAQGIDAKIIGSAGGNDYIVEGVFELPVESLKSAYYNYLPKLMRASVSLGT